ncbi:ribosomal protein L10e/L16 [Cyathus striatus]|nr:ribosomal protein L10e/L16 [Cyathus striatus]
MLSLSSFSRRVLGTAASLTGRSLFPVAPHHAPVLPSPLTLFSRNRGQLAPNKVKYAKRHKGRIPIPTGGSTKGTTLAFGDWGIRIVGNGARLSAKQLTTAQEVLKKKLKVFKGAKIYLRIFPDIPVCVKGNETRMGKGKGTFEFWATRVPTGRVIFEIGGVPIREELARDILRQASAKLPTKMEFINKTTPPRLGRLVLHPPKPVVDPSVIPEVSAATGSQPTASA